MGTENSIGQVMGQDVYSIFDKDGMDIASQWLSVATLFSPAISSILESYFETALMSARLQGLMPGSSLSRRARRYALNAAKMLEGKMQGIFEELPAFADIARIFRSRGDLEYYVEGKIQRDRESAEAAAGLVREDTAKTALRQP